MRRVSHGRPGQASSRSEKSKLTHYPRSAYCGDQAFFGENPPPSAVISWFNKKQAGEVKLKITDGFRDSAIYGIYPWIYPPLASGEVQQKLLG